MNDLNEKIEERWRQKRNKGYNWPKLIVMLAILAALIYGMGQLQKMGKSTVEPSAQVQDSTQVELPEQTP
ncbi:MAG: hypothetical protein RBR69_05745 [Candidatus Cloacimonadaceae bacterium]|jgi:hypothetical protein|nr:hypothetical protein [Candidatus Cloacimonadota bacterium]MDY0127615.1 hypothetical protein [Candidatus Cloacimonadaceae bacterium]MCB5254946.1 hypothetical protein [Candidatus Cloacimonadota bacterium]MCK9178046.1 hypothetical protein [Candidatus Cloacimonadota bacterium]MCK9242439.1 hypothetical protein [Candidatus Cloacimonadota bacterium]